MQVACALPRHDDCCSYYLTCDKGLYVPEGILSNYLNDTKQWWTTSMYNISMPLFDLQTFSYSQMVRGLVNATTTCQTCPQGKTPYDFACKFGVPDGIRPMTGVPKPVARSVVRIPNSLCSNAGQPPCTDERGMLPPDQ